MSRLETMGAERTALYLHESSRYWSSTAEFWRDRGEFDEYVHAKRWVARLEADLARKIADADSLEVA